MMSDDEMKELKYSHHDRSASEDAGRTAGASRVGLRV